MLDSTALCFSLRASQKEPPADRSMQQHSHFPPKKCQTHFRNAENGSDKGTGYRRVPKFYPAWYESGIHSSGNRPLDFLQLFGRYTALS